MKRTLRGPARRLFLWCSVVVAVSRFAFAATPAADAGVAGPDRADAGLAPGWWRDAIFYEVFVRSFADASSGPLAGDGIGDLQGLIEHLDYINDGRGPSGRSLGANAIWLMPIHPSPSYHGYDVTDYFAVNPEFGDIALMRRFVAEAHRRGIRVIIDLVLNHASSRHPLFERAVAAAPGSAARRLFRFADIPEDVAGPWNQPAWFRAGGQFYYGVFSDQMPDWNFREPAVTDHHRRVAKFWLQDVGVDGFRLDAVRYFVESGEELQDTAETRAWLNAFTAYCHELKPGAFVVGEDTGSMREVARCLTGGAMDSAFEFTLAQATIESIRLGCPGLLEQTLDRLEKLYPGGTAPWSAFLSNHDQDRVRTQLGSDEAKARLAAKLLFTLPGTTFVYYGEELGMTGTKPDPELRTPMPWNATPPNAGFTLATARPWHALRPDFRAINVAAENASDASLLALYRRMTRLREDSPALRRGATVALARHGETIFARMRATDTDAVLVLANLGDRPVRVPALSAVESPLRAGWTMREACEHDEIAAPALDVQGGFSGWRPVRELPANAVRIIRWTKP